MQNGKQCSCCGKELAASAFYKSLNPKHKDGLTPMCKKCCVKQSLDNTGDNVDLERFKNTLHFNDKPYQTELYRAAILQAEKKYSEDGTAKAETIVGLYFGKLSSLHQYRSMTWNDSTLNNNTGRIVQTVHANQEGTVFDLYCKDYPPQAIKAMQALFDLLQSIYDITDQQQKWLLSMYVSDRVISEMFIAENLTAEYDDCRQFADHELVRLKELRSIDDKIFAECYADFYDVKEGQWPWTD